jgi:hypothetical protein
MNNRDAHRFAAPSKQMHSTAPSFFASTSHPSHPLLSDPSHKNKFAEPTLVRFIDTINNNFHYITLTCIALAIANIFAAIVNEVIQTHTHALWERIVVVSIIVVFFVMWATFISVRQAQYGQQHMKTFETIGNTHPRAQTVEAACNNVNISMMPPQRDYSNEDIV